MTTMSCLIPNSPSMKRKSSREQSEPVKSPLLNKPDAAAYLNASIATLERMMRYGEVPVVYVRGRAQLLREDLDQYIAKQKTLR